MKSTLDKLEGLYRKLKIEVPADMVQSAFAKVYKEIQRSATVKGFRKGKAPMQTIKSIYNDRVKNDVLNDLISEHYQSALDKHSLEPIGYPRIHFESFVEDGDFVFSAEFEIQPEIHVKKFEGLEVDKEKLEIADSEIEKMIESIRQSHTQMVPVFEDRPAAITDVVEIDFTGFMDGQPLENGSDQRRLLELGSQQFIPGFEEALVGMTIGQERDVNLEFPKEYHNKDVAGRPVKFHVKLLALKKKSLPEIDDELAAKAGPFKTLSELREVIRKDIEDRETKRIKDETKNRLLRSLVKLNPVEVPKGLLAQQKQAIINDVQNRMKEQGVSDSDFETYKAKWDNDFEQSAAFMVQSTFLVDALATQLNLRATVQDVEAKLDEYAQQTGVERSRVANFYSVGERRSRLRFQITEERVINHLMEKAKVREVAKESLNLET